MNAEKKALLVLVGVLVTSAFTAPASASLLRMDVDELWAEADVVLLGEVEGVSTNVGEGTMIYRSYSVRVERYYKNPLEQGSVEVHVLGGQVGSTGVWVEDQPGLTPGKKVFLFLSDNKNAPSYGSGGFHVLGGPQGKFTYSDGRARNEVGDEIYPPISLLDYPVEGSDTVMAAAATLTLLVFSGWCLRKVFRA